jgi:hypothetical protein
MKQYIQVQKKCFSGWREYIYIPLDWSSLGFIVLVPSILIARNRIVICLNHHYVLILLY